MWSPAPCLTAVWELFHCPSHNLAWKPQAVMTEWGLNPVTVDCQVRVVFSVYGRHQSLIVSLWIVFIKTQITLKTFSECLISEMSAAVEIISTVKSCLWGFHLASSDQKTIFHTWIFTLQFVHWAEYDVDVETLLFTAFIFSYEERNCQIWEDSQRCEELHESGIRPVLTGAELSLHNGDKLCTGSYINRSIIWRGERWEGDECRKCFSTLSHLWRLCRKKKTFRGIKMMMLVGINLVTCLKVWVWFD